MKKPKYTHYEDMYGNMQVFSEENEITGSYHNDNDIGWVGRNWPVIIAVIIIVTAALVILLHGLEAEALMYGV